VVSLDFRLEHVRSKLSLRYVFLQLPILRDQKLFFLVHLGDKGAVLFGLGKEFVVKLIDLLLFGAESLNRLLFKPNFVVFELSDLQL
jgi:hypothetical protein